MFGSLGFTEIFFIFVVALVLFGPRKLPELGKTIGQALGQFKKASEDFKRSWETEVEVEKRRLTEDLESPKSVEAREVTPPTSPPEGTEPIAESKPDAAHATLPVVEEIAPPKEEPADQTA